MKKYIYKILFVLFAVSLFSCKKFLNEEPRHSLVEENSITNLSTAKAAIGGIYATFQNDEWAGALYTSYSSKSGFVNFNTYDYNLSYTPASPGSISPKIWSSFYRSLNSANFAIKGIGALGEEQVSTNTKDELTAEARCLRAWINANILWAFGHWWGTDDDEFGLLYRSEPAGLTNIRTARISVGKSYAKIFEDLDFAIEKLPSFSTSKYVSKEFARVLKAKLLLYRGGYRNTIPDLQTALDLVNKVLTNHPGSFGMEENMNNIYKKAWDSKECLFAKYLESNNRRVQGGYYYTYYLCQLAGNALPLPPGGELTASLVYGADWFRADPRWEIATGPVRSAETWDETMRYTFKKLARLGSYAGTRSSDPDAEKYTAYYFRFSELYLLKAELLARTGSSIAESIAPINIMRNQRTVPALPSLNPTSQTELMDMIFKEIFIENFMENGSEFFAATRFQNVGQPWIVTIKGGRSLEENKMCWPIPEAEIINNPLMVQNP